MKKGNISLETLVGFMIVLMLYVYGLYPIVRDTLNSMTNVDPVTQSVAQFIPAAFLLAIVYGIFKYARSGGNTQGYYNE